MDELALRKKSSRHQLNQSIALVPQHSLRTSTRQPQSPTKSIPSPIPTITLSTPSSTPPSLSPASSLTSSLNWSFTSSLAAYAIITEGLPKRVPPPNISKEIDIPAAFAFFQARLTARNHAKRELAREALKELNPIYVRIAKWYMYRSGPQRYRDEVDARGEQPGNPHRFEEFLIVPYTPEAPTWANNLVHQKTIYNTCRLHRDETLKAAFHIRETTMYEFSTDAERNFTYGICKFWGKRRHLEILQNEFNLSETCLVDEDFVGFDVVRGDGKGEVPYGIRDTRQSEIDKVLDNDREYMRRLFTVGGGAKQMAKKVRAERKKEQKRGKKEKITFEEYEVDEKEVDRLMERVVEYTGERDEEGKGDGFEGFGGVFKVKEVVEEKLEEGLVSKIVDLNLENEEGSLEEYESEDSIDNAFQDSAEVSIFEDSDED